MGSVAKFFQEPPELGNQFTEDVFLQRILQTTLPAAVYAAERPGLVRLGHRVATDVMDASADADLHPPVLQRYDYFGRRVDQIITTSGWKYMSTVAAEEGLIASGYSREHGEFNRVLQYARLYLFHPSSSLFSCPLAMTDGAARLLEVYGSDQQRAEVLKPLLSLDPHVFFTAGQWMTERTGGSDVSRSETIARHVSGSRYALSGFKWFTSATESRVAVALARIVDENGKAQEGSRGLSAFLVRLHDVHGRLKGIRIERLKEKLGTRSMPTAELELDGADGELIGPIGRGVPTIATILNITRLHNSVCAVAGMRRGLALVEDYAQRRETFGKKLRDHPLYVHQLARMEVDTRTCTLLVMHAVHLMGRHEVHNDKAAANLLRLLTPIVKLYTGKVGFATISEIVESMGGVGYIEDSPFPRLLRDAQVLSIWEGTTNILSLDILRAMRDPSSLKAFGAAISAFLRSAASHAALAESAKTVQAAVEKVTSYLTQLLAQQQQQRAFGEVAARPLGFSMARVYIAALTLDMAAKSGHADDVHLAVRFASGPLVDLLAPTAFDAQADQRLAFAHLSRL